MSLKLSAPSVSDPYDFSVRLPLAAKEIRKKVATDIIEKIEKQLKGTSVSRSIDRFTYEISNLALHNFEQRVDKKFASDKNNRAYQTIFEKVIEENSHYFLNDFRELLRSHLKKQSQKNPTQTLSKPKK